MNYIKRNCWKFGEKKCRSSKILGLFNCEKYTKCLSRILSLEKRTEMEKCRNAEMQKYKNKKIEKYSLYSYSIVSLHISTCILNWKTIKWIICKRFRIMLYFLISQILRFRLCTFSIYIFTFSISTLYFCTSALPHFTFSVPFSGKICLWYLYLIVGLAKRT